ncbi:Uncharacterized protein PBTT_05687 [Plasmodiophora brassicae]|uniref:Uncharacterized protein n=1 Tax=Plasmodiophora brassicae TaxID=37360 RepID=A0A0G4IPU8_PLABS|nr:hypothetical protein PBRA_000556 [Plasmodiophora brassicae]SPQ97525.1 unnamed protein product [Plasmodiophora brassicae]
MEHLRSWIRSTLPPTTMAMRVCHHSVATVAVAAALYVFVAVHKVPLRGNLVLYVAVGVVSILFLARSFRYLTHEAHLPRVQESREFFSKLRGFSLKKATYTQVDVDKNLMRVSVSIAHLQGLALFFVVFVFVSQRFVARFDPDVSLAASVIVPAALAYAAAL